MGAGPRERSTLRLLAAAGLEHDVAQAAIAASFVSPVEGASPGAVALAGEAASPDMAASPSGGASPDAVASSGAAASPSGAASPGAALAATGELLDRLSLPLFGAAALPVREQAQALAEQLTNGLRLEPEREDPRALLIDAALERRRAHPLQIAVIGHELARRAGIETFVAACGGEPWTVVSGVEGTALVGPATLAPSPRAVAVRRRCPHETAHAVLRAIRRQGPPDWSARAANLLAALPTRDCGEGPNPA